MLFRTLHWYILRELLRIFVLTASALTMLMAFGGTFRPLTRQGIDISQLMTIVIYLMPAMLAYAIPIAALFAAVLVYWRMATDNELTACRAGGISFSAMVIPALILGLAVASIDLGFVNYVVPKFLQATERAVMRDLGSLIVGQIGRQDVFRYDKWVVHADDAELRADPDGDNETVILRGVAANGIDPKSPTFVVVAQQVTLTIRDLPGQDLTEIKGTVENGRGFDSGANIVTAPVSQWPPDGQPFLVPSLVKSKPKFLNFQQLATLDDTPTLFPPVKEETERIRRAYQFQKIAGHVWEEWKKSPGGSMKFSKLGLSQLDPDRIELVAPDATIDVTRDSERQLRFSSRNGVPVRINQYRQNKLESIFTSETADMVLTSDEIGGSGISATLQLGNDAQLQNVAQGIGTMPSSARFVSGVVLTPDMKMVTDPAMTDDAQLLSVTRDSTTPAIKALNDEAWKRIYKLFDAISSERHSRGSFALSCLTLVLLGAALGILMQGKNPLAVFVVGFVPAVFLVLLITAGREMAESSHHGVPAGITTIWAGNIFLLALVASVYLKLLQK